MPDPTGPLTYDRLRELGLPETDIAAMQQRDRDQVAKLAEDRDWARKFLTRCGIEPDDPQDVRDSFEAARDDYIAWRIGAPHGEIDEDTYQTLVYAIRAYFGWVHWPLDWPAPNIALMSEPLRNLLPRRVPDA